MTVDHPRPISSQEMTQLRDRVVSSLAATANTLTGSMKRNVNRLADHLAYGEVPNCVVRHPVLLEVFVRLRDLPTPTQNQIDGVVSQTIARTYSRTRAFQPWWMILFYPLFVMGTCFVVMGGICWLIVPTFEAMFEEFGLILPAPTRALIWLSHAIRNPWLPVGLILFVILLTAMVWLISGNETSLSKRADRARGPRFRAGWFPSKRATWADWAWHLSLLIRFGKPEAEAIEIAGTASGRRWLRSGSGAWASAIKQGHRPFKDVTHFRRTPCHLMSLALNSDASIDARAKMLAFVSELYWDRDQGRTRWQLSWLSPVLIFLVGFIVWFTLTALFMPLVSLISGLS
jgi:type II secretory pathway component PulF